VTPELLTALYLGLRSVDPLPAIRAVLVAEVASGTTRDELGAVLEQLRLHLRADGRTDSEDLVLDAMDMLVGWCGPDAQI
jgi:hypothetical protein